MTEAELLEELGALAEQAGLRVQRVRAAGESESGLSSAVCRVRGETRVVLVASDPLEARIELLAAALREHAAAWLDGRWLPPALRERLAPGDEGS